MQRSLRTAHTKSNHVSCLLALSLASLCACTAPRQFGRSSTTPMPSALGGGQNLASRAPATLKVIRPAPPAPPPLYPDNVETGAPWAGLQLAMSPFAQGIFVGLVSAGSPAEAAGIQAGDYIFQLDGRAVSDALEVLSEIERVGVGGSLRFGVHRNQHVRLFRVEPVARPAPVSVEALAAPPAAATLPSAALEQPKPTQRD
ncbi:MAG TPA: PDZ domain-containing protein [Polyangiaceae bacterium]|jgi:predicted metalloprotease with PDZ domain|nr:PDZ domain-containing protein [Polyangiaceae bacterium]